MAVGQPSERELMCLCRAKLWEGLIPFATLFDESVDQSVDQSVVRAKKKLAKPEYDWRVVVANARRT